MADDNETDAGDVGTPELTSPRLFFGLAAQPGPAATADDGRDGRPEVGPSGQHGGGSGGPQAPWANAADTATSQAGVPRGAHDR